MSTSRQAFSQVKDILKKLDQSIDAARQKRVASDPQRPNGAARPGENGAPRPGPTNGQPGNSGTLTRRVG